MHKRWSRSSDCQMLSSDAAAQLEPLLPSQSGRQLSPLGCQEEYAGPCPLAHVLREIPLLATLQELHGVLDEERARAAPISDRVRYGDPAAAGFAEPRQKREELAKEHREWRRQCPDARAAARAELELGVGGDVPPLLQK